MNIKVIILLAIPLIMTITGALLVIRFFIKRGTGGKWKLFWGWVLLIAGVQVLLMTTWLIIYEDD
jgi:uncharacterized membrane protein HdeD (DUF308 family)